MTKHTVTKSSEKIKSETLTQERLKQELCYNPRSGRFKRVLTDIPPENGHLVPTNGRGRSRISVLGKVYESSRLAMLWMEGYLPEKPLEHRNGRLYDNRWKNLVEIGSQSTQPQIPPELHDIANRVLALFQGRMVSPAPEIERRA